MELVAAAMWPTVALVAVFAFRGPVSRIFQRPPSELELNAGPVGGRVIWDTAVDEALETLDGSEETAPARVESDAEGRANNFPESPPPAALPLRLRAAARLAPAGAIAEAWMIVDSEVDKFAAEWTAESLSDERRSVRRRISLESAIAGKKLAEWTPLMLKSLRELRNIAVHQRSVTSDEAFEFLSMADLVVNELRRAADPQSPR